MRDPDYGRITQSQTDWFTRSSRALRDARDKDFNGSRPHLSLDFMHIPLPEYAEGNLIIRGGSCGEPVVGTAISNHHSCYMEALKGTGNWVQSDTGQDVGMTSIVDALYIVCVCPGFPALDAP